MILEISPVESTGFSGRAHGRKIYNFESSQALEKNAIIPYGKNPRPGTGKASGAGIHLRQDLAAFDAPPLFRVTFFHGKTWDSFQVFIYGKKR